jgi:hypothetical protein
MTEKHTPPQAERDLTEEIDSIKRDATELCSSPVDGIIENLGFGNYSAISTVAHQLAILINPPPEQSYLLSESFDGHPDATAWYNQIRDSRQVFVDWIIEAWSSQDPETSRKIKTSVTILAGAFQHPDHYLGLILKHSNNIINLLYQTLSDEDKEKLTKQE